MLTIGKGNAYNLTKESEFWLDTNNWKIANYQHNISFIIHLPLVVEIPNKINQNFQLCITSYRLLNGPIFFVIRYRCGNYYSSNQLGQVLYRRTLESSPCKTFLNFLKLMGFRASQSSSTMNRRFRGQRRHLARGYKLWTSLYKMPCCSMQW